MLETGDKLLYLTYYSFCEIAPVPTKLMVAAAVQDEVRFILSRAPTLFDDLHVAQHVFNW